VTVAGDAAHRITKQSQMHYLWQLYQTLDITPVIYIIVMQIQKSELGHSGKNFSRWQIRKVIIAQIQFL